MRTFQTAASLLSPYEQKRKDEIEKQQSGESRAGESSAESLAEVEEDTSREGMLSLFPGPNNRDGGATSTAVAEVAESKGSAAEPEAKPETEPAVETPPSSPTAESGLSGEERKLLDSIYEIERRIIELAAEEETLADSLKDVRQSLGDARDTKSALLDALPGSLIKIRQGETAETILDDTKAAVKEAKEPKPFNWRHIATRDLAKGVEGLGPRKMELLCEAYPTAGDLNDARAAAAQLNTHFQEQLPRTIGKKIANELSDRLMAAETNHDTPPASEQVKQNGTETEETKTGPARDRTAHVRLVETIERSVRATMDTPRSLDSDDDEAWQAGSDAYNAGEDTGVCPDTFGPDRITEWVKGWLAAEMMASFEDQCVEPTETDAEPGETETVSDETKPTETSDPAETTETPPKDNADAASSPGSSDASTPSGGPGDSDVASDSDGPDDSDEHTIRIAAIEEAVRAGGDTEQQDKNPHWADGHMKAIDGIPIESCPPSLSEEDAIQFVKGWIHGSSFTGGL